MKTNKHMPQSNRLFFVSSANRDGSRNDLLVVATDKPQATEFWREHYGLDACPAWVGVVPGVAPEENCEVGPIDWDAIRMD